MKITVKQLRKIIKESIQSPRDELMSALQSKFDISFMKVTEEFYSESRDINGIWLSAEDRDMMPNGKDLIFDYYSTNYDMYDIGVNMKFMDFLEQYGWYAEWNDAGTIMLWPVANTPSMMEADGTTEKYDNDSALKGKQSKLPDALQKSIVDKVVEDRDETEEKEKKSKLVKEGGDNWYRYGYDVCQSADTEPTDSLRAPWKGSDPAAIAIYNDLYKGTREHKEFVDGWNACLAIQEGNKMKITKRQLRKIIQEEKSRILTESASTTGHEFESIMLQIGELVEEAFELAGSPEAARGYWYNTILGQVNPEQYGMMNRSLSMADTLEELRDSGRGVEGDMMEMGYNDGTAGKPPAHPDNEYYMVNYNDGKKEAGGY